MNGKTLIYQFDDVRVNVASFKVLKADSAAEIEPKAFEVLVYLIENRGRLVEKDELLDALWKDAYVTQNALTRVIAQLRKVLGDDFKEARYIETVHKKGYRFLPDVEVVQDASNPPREPNGASADGFPRPESDRVGSSESNPIRERSRGLWAAAGAAVIVLLVGVIGVLLWVISTKTQVWEKTSASEIKTMQLTTWNGLDLFPALSPDGNALAYSSDHGGRFEVFVKPLAPGGRELQITSDGGPNLQPAWSPDGKLLAYYSQNKGGLWVVPALGGVPRQLTEFGAHPVWSPDGTLIAFQSEGVFDLGPMSFAAPPPSTLWVVPVLGGTPRRVTELGNPIGGHGSPSWSPDGKRLAFVATDIMTAEIWSVSVSGGDLKRLIRNRWGSMDPVFSPDGKKLYFSGPTKDKNYFLWEIDLSPETGEAVGDPIELYNTGAVILRYPTLSADGRKIVYSALQMDNHLWSVPLSRTTGEEEGPPVALTTDTSFRKTLPKFSPDGKRVAFNVRINGMAPDVWCIDADGKNMTQVTTDPAGDTLFGWLPDGRILFGTDRLPLPAVWTKDLSSGVEKKYRECNVKTMVPFWAYPHLSPDGKRLAFNSRRSGPMNVEVLALESGEVRQLTFDKEFTGYPAWSPDGRELAVEVKQGEYVQVGVMPSDGGEIRLLTNDKGQSWGYSWFGDRVAFAGHRDGVWNVYWVSRSTGEQKRVTNFDRPNIYVRYPEWSPLGNQIVFEYAEVTGNIWMLDLGKPTIPRMPEIGQ